jgi:hypothetical protein
MPLLNYAILSLLSEKKVDYSLWTKAVVEDKVMKLGTKGITRVKV